METRGLGDNDALGLLIESVIGSMFFTRPGIIKKFYPEKQRADVVVGIKYKKPVKDGKAEYEELPIILNVPIAMQYSPEAGLASTFPIREKDPCTLLFSDRMINLYIQKREMSLPEESGQDNVTSQPRQHEMEDAMCFPGVITKRDVLPNWNNNAWEIRNKQRTAFISLNVNNDITMRTTGNISIKNDGYLSINSGGNISITSQSDVSIDSGGIATINNGSSEDEESASTVNENGSCGCAGSCSNSATNSCCSATSTGSMCSKGSCAGGSQNNCMKMDNFGSLRLKGIINV